MAVYANISIDQGSTFSSTVSVEDSVGEPFDLTDYTARAQMRKTYRSTKVFDFDAGITSPSIGEIILKMPASQTSKLKSGRYVYDVEVVSPDGEVTRVVEGQIELMPRVTLPIEALEIEELLVYGDLGPVSENILDPFGVPIGNFAGFVDLMDPPSELLSNDLGTM
jgi:hypothetical protein